MIIVDDSSGKIAGSIRQRFPDPWDTDALNVGRTYAATVIKHVQTADRCNDGPAYLVELIPGAFAMLCTSESDLMPGDTCKVAITKSNPDKHAVTISRVNGK